MGASAQQSSTAALQQSARRSPKENNMAPVRLSDAFVPDIYGSYFSVDNPETSLFYQSGIVARNEVLDGIAKGGGKLATIPFWRDIDPTIEPNYSNDDPTDMATPNKIGSGTMTARKAWLNQGFADMDLVQELAGSSPMQHIRNRFGTYWLRQWQRRLVATTLGVLNDNIANDSGDMVIDISAESGANAVFNADAFVDAGYTMGQFVENLGTIYVHSDIMKVMVKNDDIVYIPDSAGNLTIPTYKGLRVIMETNPMLVRSPGVYVSVMFGTGAIGWGGAEGHAFAMGEGLPRVPFEVARSPRAGNGGGMEEIWERNTWLLHPFGYRWVEVEGSGGLTEFSPTLTDLQNAAYWERVVERTQVPLAFLITRAAVQGS